MIYVYDIERVKRQGTAFVPGSARDISCVPYHNRLFLSRSVRRDGCAFHRTCVYAKDPQLFRSRLTNTVWISGDRCGHGKGVGVLSSVLTGCGDAFGADIRIMLLCYMNSTDTSPAAYEGADYRTICLSDTGSVLWNDSYSRFCCQQTSRKSVKEIVQTRIAGLIHVQKKIDRPCSQTWRSIYFWL